jgi:transposase
MKLDFTKPAPQLRTLEEAQELIQALWTLCTEIPKLKKHIADLEEKLNTNSNNSSKPPSGDRFKSNHNKQNQERKRNRGGQPGHPGITRHLLPEIEVDHIERHLPSERCSCGGSIQTTLRYQRHQVHELPPVKLEVTEHQLFYGNFTQCRKEHCAKLPQAIPTGMLGFRLLAFIAVLTSDYKLSKRDVTRLFMDLFKLSMSVATIKRAEETVSEAIKIPVDEAKEYVRNQAIVNCDETSHAECGKRKWTWVAIAGTVAVFLIAATRSAAAAKELLGVSFKGILGSDRFSAYSWIAAIFRQVCWAHLKRDFKKISERTGKSKKIGLQLLACTQQMFHYWHKVRDGTMTREKFKETMKPICRKVESLLNAGAKVRNLKTKGTCLEILKVKKALWRFIETVGLEPTNNIAERVLRQVVIWRKICFGTWSKDGSIYLSRVTTVVASCRLQECSAFDFLCDAVEAHLNGKKSPSLLPNQATASIELAEAA